MIRRISTKWLLAVLAVVVLPFLGFAWFVDAFVSQRFSEDVVRYHLLGHAAELSERLDNKVMERRKDARLLAAVQDVSRCLSGYQEDTVDFSPSVEQIFNGLVVEIGSADFVVGLDTDGNAVVSSSYSADGKRLDRRTTGALRAYPWAEAPWFQEALESGAASIDVTKFGFVHEGAAPEDRYHFGFAHRVMGKRSTFSATVPVGLVVTLVPWSTVQSETEAFGVSRPRKEELGDLGSETLYASSYAWVWADDAATILAHKDRSLYGSRVDEPPVGLPKMVAAARSAKWGMYPEYDFAGVHKKAAFRHGRSRAEGGFGWVVGVGLNTEDVYGPIHSMTATLAKASALVLLIAVVVTFLVARRTTQPIQDLEAFTRRVASGDLDAQVPVKGHDELSDLARSFNRMTSRLKENSEQLVKAEKDAAWREMARQVAHEIKNPLTPIQLWASLLKRAHDDQSPEFESILEKTIDVVQKQVRTMRDIAKDFYRFAGEHRDPVPVSVDEVLSEVLTLNSAWASEEDVHMARSERRDGDSSGEGLEVLADPDELRRALVNLVSNAMEAIDGTEPPPGQSSHSVEAWVEREGNFARILIQDTGKGISPEAEEGLFQPYFTTRSSGTGLGLAIVRRIVEDRGGSVSLENREDVRGAVATLRLPLLRESGPSAGSSAAPASGELP
jgi:signal transduction histidine kinase